MALFFEGSRVTFLTKWGGLYCLRYLLNLKMEIISVGSIEDCVFLL